MRKILALILACLLMMSILPTFAESDDPDSILVQNLQDATDEELAQALEMIENEIRARINTHIVLDKTELNLVKGRNEKLTPELADLAEDVTAGEYVWESSDESVAKVNNWGQVNAVGTGNAVITCKTLLSTNIEIKAECAVRVYIPVASLNINPRSFTLARGTQAELVCTVNPADATDQTVIFSSSDEAVATVSEEGIITAKEIGGCVITVAAQDGSEKKAEARVSVRQEVQGITLDAASGTVAVGKTQRVIGTVTPDNANEKKINWTSADETIATVDWGGTIKGVAPGTTTITASAADGAGASATYQVEVIQPMAKINTEDNKIILAPGTYWKQAITISPENTTNQTIIWTSSDEAVATVDENGTITAAAKGRCQITGVAEDGCGAKTTVNVEVQEFDYVLTTPDVISVDFETEYESSIMMGVTNRGSYKVIEERETDFGDGCVTSAGSKMIRPVKAGSDKVTVKYKKNKKVKDKKVYTVYVAQSAVEGLN